MLNLLLHKTILEAVIGHCFKKGFQKKEGNGKSPIVMCDFVVIFKMSCFIKKILSWQDGDNN